MHQELRQSIKYVQDNYSNDGIALIGLVQNFVNFIQVTINKHKDSLVQNGQLNSQNELTELNQLIKEAQMVANYSKIIYKQIQEVQQQFLDNYANYQRQKNHANMAALQTEFINIMSKLLRDIIER